jgi:hypothetical protein
MSLKKLNFTKASNVIDIFDGVMLATSDIMISYNYNGYDVKDLVNSLKLTIAYQLLYPNEFVSKTETKDDAKHYDFHLDFYAFNIECIENRTTKYDDFLGSETVTMFYEQCLKFKKNEPDNYWNAVFSHLSIECDESDKDDRIYEKLIRENDKKVNSKKEPIEKPAEIYKENSEGLEGLVHLIAISILFFSFSNETIRLISFTLLTIAYLILIALRIGAKAYISIRHKLELIYDLLKVFFLIYGIFDNGIGIIMTYVLIIIFIFDLIKYMVKVVSKEN